ncbi:MAG: hypothetical protein AB1831_04000 [Pseudomonadota bacterium]
MLKNMPDWLYEPLPYLYTLMGFIAISMLDVWVGKLSGVMLISAGVVIWHLRFTYRRRRRRPVKRDLSWGYNQRMHPPKNLDKAETQATRQSKPAPKEEKEEF